MGSLIAAAAAVAGGVAASAAAGMYIWLWSTSVPSVWLLLLLVAVALWCRGRVVVSSAADGDLYLLRASGRRAVCRSAVAAAMSLPA